MLQVTDGAVAVFKHILEDQSAPDASIRLAPTVEAGEEGILVQVVDAPVEGDRATEASGVDVFLAPELAEPLDAAVLDVAQSQEMVQLVLRPQPPIG